MHQLYFCEAKFTCFRIGSLPNEVPFLNTEVEEKSSEIGVGF